jgi:hypothetical protein
MTALPPELLLTCFEQVRSGAPIWRRPDAASCADALSDQRTLACAMGVCRAWRAAATQVLYAAPIVTSPMSLGAFTAALRSDTLLAPLVCVVTVLEIIEAPVEASPAETVGELEAAGISYQDETRRYFVNEARLSAFFTACANMLSLHSLYHAPAGVRPLPQSSDAALLGRTLNRILSSPWHGAFPRSVKSLTLRGGSTEMPIFTPQAISSLERIPHLRVLNLQNTVFCDLGALTFPALEELTVARCVFARLVITDCVLPRTAPRLKRLVLDSNHDMELRSSADPSASSMARFAALEEVFLAGHHEVGLLRHNRSTWAQNTAIHYITIDFAVASYTSVPWMGFGFALPPNIRCLTLLHNGSTISCCFGGYEPAEESHAQVQLLNWATLHISGSEPEKCRMLAQRLQEATATMGSLLGNPE